MIVQRNSASTSAKLRYVLVAFCLGTGMHVHAQDRESARRTAHQLREVLAFDLVTLAAMSVTDASYDTIAAEAYLFAKKNEAALAPALRAISDIRAKMGMPGAAAHQDTLIAELQTAYQTVAQAAAALPASLTPILDSDNKARHLNAIANAGLDPLLRLVDLSDKQRTALFRASARRDLVLRNPYKRNRASLVAKARTTCDTEIDAVLSATQREKLALYTDLAEMNLKRMWERDRAVAGNRGADAQVQRHTLLAFAGSAWPATSFLMNAAEVVIRLTRLNGLTLRTLITRITAVAVVTPTDAEHTDTFAQGTVSNSMGNITVSHNQE